MISSNVKSKGDTTCPSSPLTARNIATKYQLTIDKGIGTTGAFATAILKPRGRKYLFVPATMHQVYQLVTHSFALLHIRTARELTWGTQHAPNFMRPRLRPGPHRGSLQHSLVS